MAEDRNKRNRDKSSERDCNLDHEFAELGETLDKFTVKYPSEAEIKVTVDSLRIYVPPKVTGREPATRLPRLWKCRATLAGWRGLLRQAAADLTIVSPLYWLASLILFAVGCIFTWYAGASPYRTMALLAPIPALAGIAELFKGRELGVLEMELACRYSAAQLLLSRLFLLGIYNIGLNVLVSVCLLVLMPQTIPGLLLISWLTPFAVVMALALWLSMLFRGGVFLTIGLSIWTSALLALITMPEVAAFFYDFNVWVCGALIAASLFIGTVRLKQMTDKYRLFETGEHYAVGH